MEQAPECQVHGPHGAPLLEHGTQHQSVRPQAVRDDQVSQQFFFCSVFSSCPVLFLNTTRSSSQVLLAADVEAVPVGEGSPDVGRQGNCAEAEDEGRAGPLLHHLRGQYARREHFSHQGCEI